RDAVPRTAATPSTPPAAAASALAALTSIAAHLLGSAAGVDRSTAAFLLRSHRARWARGSSLPVPVPVSASILIASTVLIAPPIRRIATAGARSTAVPISVPASIPASRGGIGAVTTVAGPMTAWPLVTVAAVVTVSRVVAALAARRGG